MLDCCCTPCWVTTRVIRGWLCAHACRTAHARRATRCSSLRAYGCRLRFVYRLPLPPCATAVTVLAPPPDADSRGWFLTTTSSAGFCGLRVTRCAACAHCAPHYLRFIFPCYRLVGQFTDRYWFLRYTLLRTTLLVQFYWFLQLSLFACLRVRTLGWRNTV